MLLLFFATRSLRPLIPGEARDSRALTPAARRRSQASHATLCDRGWTLGTRVTQIGVRTAPCLSGSVGPFERPSCLRPPGASLSRRLRRRRYQRERLCKGERDSAELAAIRVRGVRQPQDHCLVGFLILPRRLFRGGRRRSNRVVVRVPGLGSPLAIRPAYARRALRTGHSEDRY
jgi:hypothetical protein